MLSAAIGVPGHKPTLTQLLSSTDLDSLLKSKERIPEEDEGKDDDQDVNPVELPLPPPLSHQLFEGPDFNPSDFLLKRRHIGLDDLRSELRAYLATLRESLVAVINSEYEAFIGLSLGLRHASVSTSLTTIRRPILSVRHEITRVKSELEGMRDGMCGVLEQRKQVKEKSATLRRLLEMENAVEKVEKLLKLGSSAAGSDSAVTGSAADARSDPSAKRLERIAGEYTHMLYLVGKAGDLPFVRSLDPRVARITSTLHYELSQLLSTVLQKSVFRQIANTTSIPSHDSLLTLLRTYASINMAQTAEEVIRLSVVRPRLHSIIHRDVISNYTPTPPKISTSPRSNGIGDSERGHIESTRTGAGFYSIEPLPLDSPQWSFSTGGLAEYDIHPLGSLYNSLLTFISQECSTFLDVTERTLSPPSSQSVAESVSGKRTPITSISTDMAEDESKTRSVGDEGYRVLSNVVWDEIGNRLMSELGHIIFSAGRPTVFQRNYLLTMAFIERIEDLSPSVSHLNGLRSHPTYIAFMKRFQLPVYFQLRFKEIVTALERAFSVGSASGGGDVFVMSESEAVWKALKMCWHEEVYLTPLSARFWRLSLQLLSRYRMWLDNAVPKYVLPASASSINLPGLSVGATGAPLSKTSFDGPRERTVSSNSSTRPGTPSMGGTPSLGSDRENISEETSLRQLTILIADSSLMVKRGMQLYEEQISLKLVLNNSGEMNGGEPMDPSVVFYDSLGQVSSIVPNLSSQIVTILTKRCAEHLKSVRSVASQVRASTRKGPSEPSYFVANILKELRAYLTGPGRVIEEELRTKWATAVVEDVASRYAAILSTQKKTEDSLRWFKKGRQQLSLFGRGGASSTADETNSPEDDRVKMQMQLDVDTLGQDAESLGVNVSESGAFRQLRSAIVDPTSTSAEKK